MSALVFLEEAGRLPGCPGRKAEHLDPIQQLNGPLVTPKRHHREHLDASADQLAADHPGGPAVAAVLAPGEDLHAEEADSHGVAA